MAKSKTRLMLPNDVRWTTNAPHSALGGRCVFMRNNHEWICMDSLAFTSIQMICDAAAVAACWWWNEFLRRQSSTALGADKAYQQFFCWLALTTATSLDGYEFEPWKEME